VANLFLLYLAGAHQGGGAKGAVAPGDNSGKVFKDGKKVDNIIIHLYLKIKLN
jgi:hypothetical protein